MANKTRFLIELCECQRINRSYQIRTHRRRHSNEPGHKRIQSLHYCTKCRTAKERKESLTEFATQHQACSSQQYLEESQVRMFFETPEAEWGVLNRANQLREDLRLSSDEDEPTSQRRPQPLDSSPEPGPSSPSRRLDEAIMDCLDSTPEPPAAEVLPTAPPSQEPVTAAPEAPAPEPSSTQPRPRFEPLTLFILAFIHILLIAAHWL